MHIANGICNDGEVKAQSGKLAYLPVVSDSCSSGTDTLPLFRSMQCPIVRLSPEEQPEKTGVFSYCLFRSGKISVHVSVFGYAAVNRVFDNKDWKLGDICPAPMVSC